MGKPIIVIKADGSKEEFNPQKVIDAVMRTGVSEAEAQLVIERLTPRLYNGIPTNKIYQNVFKILRHLEPNASTKYNLRNALFELGPAGYVFESFIIKLLSKNGFVAQKGGILVGKCIKHEVDGIASNGKETYMIECKFHNSPTIKSHSQEALYTYARFLDLQQGAEKGLSPKFTKPWLISNTKFTTDVIDYAKCIGMKLLGWRYPVEGGLEKMIEESKCYPVTIFNSGKRINANLFKNGIITIEDLPKNENELIKLGGMTGSNAKQIIVNMRELKRG